MMAFRSGRQGARGQQLIELAAGLAFVVPLILALVDVAFVFIGATANDGIARDAARSAACADPRTDAPGKARAQQILTQYARRYPSGGSIAVDSTLDSSNYQVNRVPSTAPSVQIGGPFPGWSVSVKTRVTVHIPAAAPWCGIQPSYTFLAQSSYPVTYVLPPGP